MSKFILPFITITEIEWVDLKGEREVTIRTDYISSITPVSSAHRPYNDDGGRLDVKACIFVANGSHGIYTKESADEIREMIGRLPIEQRLVKLEEQVAHLQEGVE